MPDCPFRPSDSPCELEMDLMILREAEQESMEIFYAMREELRFYLMSRPGCSVVKWTGGFVGRSRTRMSGGRGE